jgi:hypothetical protein
LPILWCPLCYANTIGTAIHAPLIGEGQGRNKNLQKHLIGAANAPGFAIGAESATRFTYKCMVNRSAINISCAIYIAPILLALHCSYTISHIFLELAYNLGSTDRKQKYGKTKMKSK